MAGIILCVVTDDGTVRHINHVLGDIGGLIGDPLQMPRDQQKVNEGLDFFRVLFDVRLDRDKDFSVDDINFIIGSADLLWPRRHPS